MATLEVDSVAMVVELVDLGELFCALICMIYECPGKKFCLSEYSEEKQYAACTNHH